MKVLVVYEEVPEDTKLYILYVGDDEWDSLKAAQGCYINGTEMTEEQQAACDALSECLVGQPELPKDQPVYVHLAGIDVVLVSGFLL